MCDRDCGTVRWWPIILVLISSILYRMLRLKYQTIMVTRRTRQTIVFRYVNFVIISFLNINTITFCSWKCCVRSTIIGSSSDVLNGCCVYDACNCNFHLLFFKVETRAYPELMDATGDTSVPIWIIIVSVVGGLLLLALFTYILWKLGFFKRRRPDPTLSGNLEKHSENKLLLQNNKL